MNTHAADESVTAGSSSNHGTGRLTFVLALSVVLGFLATSLASYVVSMASVRRQIVADELPLAQDSIHSQIRRDLLEPVSLSSFMAHDTFVQEWIAGGEKESERMIRYLKEIQTKHGTLTSFFVSEATRIYYQAEGILKTVREDEERDRWYFRVREMEHAYETNFDPDMANNDALTIFVNHRVHGSDGTYLGAIGVGLMVREIADSFARYQEEHGCTVFLADRDGTVVLRAPDRRFRAGNIRQMPGLKGLADEILADTAAFAGRGEGREWAHVSARFIDELGWYLIVARPEARQVRGIRRALFANLAVCALITVLVLFLTGKTVAVYRRRIERLAIVDPLTGLHNRRAFDVLFDAAIRDCTRRRTKCSLIFFDIDHFKDINDVHGHVFGDGVLRKVALATTQVLRASDSVCRWGGDEFAAILKDCGLADAVGAAEKIRDAIGGLAVLGGEGGVAVTVSLGVAEVRPDESEDSALQRADRALYLAKQGGRDRTETAAPDQPARSS